MDEDVGITKTIKLYQLETNYKVGTKDPQLEKDASVPARLARMKEKYEKEGIRNTVDGVLLVHRYNHPHVLLLRIGNSFYKLYDIICFICLFMTCRSA